jgi:hypothetical protein
MSKNTLQTVNTLLQKGSKTLTLLLTALLLSLGCQAMRAATTTKPYCLVVYTTDGSTTAFALAHHPRTTLYSRTFRIISDVADVEFFATDILRFTLEEIRGVVTPVEELAAETFRPSSEAGNSPQLNLTPGSFSLYGLRSGSSVSVHDSSGRIIQSANADSNGSLSLTMESLRPGVYIVRTEKSSFKIIRK